MKLKTVSLFLSTLPAVMHARAAQLAETPVVQRLRASKAGATGLALVVGSAGALADTVADPASPEEGIGTARTKLLALIALGGVAMLVLALASVGWEGAVKWVKRLRRAS